jgi:hypothetical protein
VAHAAAAKDIALYAIEVCAALPLEHFHDLPIGELGTLRDLGTCAGPLFALTKDAVIRGIARTARTEYPEFATAAGLAAATRVIVDAIGDLRDDDRLTHIAEVATPDGTEGQALTARLGKPAADDDPFHALFPYVRQAADALLDAIEFDLASRTGTTER